MFAGHLGAALVIGRADRRLNPGVLALAALLLDVLLWLFVLLGWESVVISDSFARTHQPEYDFPYSHGFLWALGWSGLSALVAVALCWGWRSGRFRVAAFVALAVFSHWLLDALVHGPELPFAGASSVKLGLGLWSSPGLGLGLEVGITLLGALVLLRDQTLRRSRRLAMGGVVLGVLVLTVLGMTVAPPPPSAQAMAASSLLTIGVVVGVMVWLGKRGG